MEIGGHYTYYEKNPCMQNYMISSRKKNGVFPSETVEDRAAQDFRNLARNRRAHRKEKKTGGLMYAASACLVLVLIIMGVSMINSFDRMKSVQSTLETLADTSDSAQTQETSGSVTAVTSREQTEDPDEAQPSAETEGAGTDAQSGDAPESGQDAEAAQSGTGTESTGENGSDGVYVVEEGDTLAIISKKMYGDVTHVDAICQMNGITDGNLIYVGQKLLLP